MFSCSYDAEVWIRHALNCLPEEVRVSIIGRLAFVCVDSSNARRLTRKFCENHEIIILSERIVPRGVIAEDDWKVRYFWFAVLHEIAHAYCNHQPPNAISEESNAAQENQADELAFSWFNTYLQSKGLLVFTDHELKAAQQKK